MILASVSGAPAALAALGLIGHGVSRGGLLAPWVMVSTLLLSTAMAYLVLRAGTARRAGYRCVLVAPPLGAINVGLSLALMNLFSGTLGESVRMLFAGSLLGVAVGAPVGLVYGLAFVAPAVAAVHGRMGASHAAGERALMIIGGWLSAASFLALALQQASPWLLVVPAMVGLVVGAVVALVGGAHTLRRRHWLRRVRRGTMPGWSIEPRSERAHDAALRPFVNASESRCPNLLVRCQVAGAYRDRADAVPVAFC